MQYMQTSGRIEEGDGMCYILPQILYVSLCLLEYMYLSTVPKQQLFPKESEKVLYMHSPLPPKALIYNMNVHR